MYNDITPFTNNECIADKDDPQRLHHPGLPGEMDPADQDGHPGSGGVVRSQPGEGGSTGPCGMLLWKPLLQPLLQVQQERGQAQRGDGGLILNIRHVRCVLNEQKLLNAEPS